MVTQTRLVSRFWSEDEYLESYEEETYNIWLNLDYRDQRGGEQLEIKF